MLDKVKDQAEGVRILRRVVGGHLTTPLLLVGPSGVGKRFSVIQAAKEELSEGDPESFHCIQIANGSHPDLIQVIPQDQKSLGVDVARGLVDLAEAYPSLAPVRYVIIDGADRLTLPAADALLKVLEEPPETTRFFLLAEKASQVIPTIRSRCGEVRYRPLSEALIVAHLKGYGDGLKALVCARLSGGSAGRAFQLLVSGRLVLRDQVLKMLQVGASGDTSMLLAAVDDLENDLDQALLFFEAILKDLVLYPYDSNRVSNLDTVEQLVQIRAILGDSGLERLLNGWEILQRRRKLGINLLFHLKSYLLSALGG